MHNPKSHHRRDVDIPAKEALLSYVQQLHVRSARSACPKKVLLLSSFLLPVLGMIELNPYFLI